MQWKITEVHDSTAIDGVKELFSEYADWLGDVVCAQGLEDETTALPGPYAEPEGCLWLATDSQGTPVGCVGLRPHDEGIAEIKRLYVRPDARGSGLGMALAHVAMDRAERLGYGAVRVTTLPATMDKAAGIYRHMGFSEVEPFHDFSGVRDDVEICYLECAF